MEKMLKECIGAYKAGYNDSLVDINEKMMPLAKKYSSKLQTYMDYDDAMQEFTVTFIECARSIKDWSSEESCLQYFKKAVINHYMMLISDAQEKSQWEVSDEEYINIPSENSDEYEVIILKYSLVQMGDFSEKKQIILCLLCDGYSCQDIAKEMNVSRQYINKVRVQLRNFFEKMNIKFA